MATKEVKLPPGVETRAFAEFRVKRAKDGEAATIEGHAATFNDPYPIADFEEQVAPGAFADSITDGDVRALFNHDPNFVLGRQSSGTLRLSEDDVGLRSEIDLPRSAESVREGIERGDIREMSFGFSVESEKWEAREGKPDLRTIEKAQLWDVSPVTFPANPNTDVALRRRDEWRSQLDASGSQREDAAGEEEATPDVAVLAGLCFAQRARLEEALALLSERDVEQPEDPAIADDEPADPIPVPAAVEAELALMEAELSMGRHRAA